jgi:hypothetical protein
MAFSGSVRIDSGEEMQEQQNQQQVPSNGYGNAAANNSNSFGQVRFNGENMESANTKSGSGQVGKAVDSKSILGSAKNPYSKQPEAVNQNSLVTLPGFGETDVATAIHLGFIEHDPATGGLREVPQEQQQTPSNPKAEEQAQMNQAQRQAWTNNPVDRETRKAFDEFDMVYGEQFTDSLIATAINEMAKGADNIDTNNFKQYANRAKMEPEEMLKKVDRIIGGFQDQAVRYIQRNHPGVNGKEVVNWLLSGEIDQNNVREIFNQHIHHKNLKVYDNVVKAFKAKG